MPLTPAIRPVRNISNTAETPIRTPPSREAMGVKEWLIIFLSPLFDPGRSGLLNESLTLPPKLRCKTNGFFQPFR
jgi:hypothetical protein